MEDKNIIAIRKEDVSAADSAFAFLMQKTEDCLNEKAKENVQEYKSLTASELEMVSMSVIQQSCEGTPFRHDEIKLISGQKFPDIIAEQYYGVEVKSTNKNHWTSTGSSIVETTRVADVESIYMLFGKLGGTPAEFRCRPYQDVLSEIAVTHSPRYLIDMGLNAGETIFDKMAIKYDDLRSSSDSIAKIKRYYKAKAEANGNQMPWWISGDDEERSVGMNIRVWKGLSADEKSDMVAKMLVLFPEVISGNYDRAAMWLAGVQGVVCTNIRDPFSAGGKVRRIDGKELLSPLPKIIKTLSDKYPLIIPLLKEDSSICDFIQEYNPSLLEGTISDKWFEMVCNQLMNKGIIIDIRNILEDGLDVE